MLALVLVFILLTVCHECRRLYHDLERQSEKWLEAVTAAVLSVEPAVEHCGTHSWQRVVG